MPHWSALHWQVLGAAICVALYLSAGAYAEDPWADEVISYNAIDPNQGFNTPEKAIGEPVGGGTYAPNNNSLHSVGRPGPAPGSYIILKFNTPVTDDPQNPMGLDCIVFGNNFWVGGNPERKWIEAGIIEISEDVNGNGLADDPWYLIPGSREYDRSVLPEGISNPDPPLAGNVLNPNTEGTEYNWGYCELTPTQRKYLDNYVRPDDPFEVGLTPRSGGGDAFDIAWAVDETGAPAGLSQFHFIRVSAFIDLLDGPFGYITPEIDAVADVAPDVDNDEDGILDEYEIRVAGTDPARPESTVLALEIPPEDGGSPAGTELGTAEDAQGNAITLFSNGLRSGFRDYNCIVDILTVGDPAPAQSIPSLEKSGAVREFQSSVSDFEAGQVQHAELSIVYTSLEITGLDEPALQPYRFSGGVFTQDGISSVTKDTAENSLTFRSQYPGTFLLASLPGEGDIDPGAGENVFHASPPQGQVGEPGTEASATSDPIHLPDESLVPDGTHFTVATTLGTISTADQDGATPGIQVSASGGVIAFTIVGGTSAGTAAVTAASLDGVLHGQLNYVFAAGTPLGPIDIYLLDPSTVAPGPIAYTTSQVFDAYGNPLDAGAYLTLVVEGGQAVTPDASPGDPGHQVALLQGVATFLVRAETRKSSDSALVTVALYADPEETVLLGEATHIFEVVQMPLCISGALAATLGLAGILGLRRRRRSA